MAERSSRRALGNGKLVLLAWSIALLAGPHPAGAGVQADGQHSSIERFLTRIAAKVTSKCITPAVDGVFVDLVRSDAFQRSLGDRFAVERADARGDHIDLLIRDVVDHHEHGVTLALTDSRGGTPDGEGTHFLFFLSDPPDRRDPAASSTLLALAALLDNAIPESALVRCSGEDNAGPQGIQVEASSTVPGPDGLQGGERRYPLSLALASAALELGVVLAAIVFGLHAIRSREE